MPLTSIDEKFFKNFEDIMRERIIKLRTIMSSDSFLDGENGNKDMYVNEIRRCKTYLVNRDTYRLEDAPGFYYLSFSMMYSLREDSEKFWIHTKAREAYLNEDMDEFYRLIGNNDDISISDYGIADNIEQVQEYLKKIEPITGLDNERYFVEIANHPPQESEWRKHGPYIGTTDDPSEVSVITWHIHVMK